LVGVLGRKLWPVGNQPILLRAYQVDQLNRRSVAIIDDHPIFRAGVAATLSEHSGFGPIFQGASTLDAVRIVAEHEPDLLLLDLSMPGGGGLSALEQICAIGARTRCILLTSCDEARVAIKALDKGAKGYVLKGVGAEELISVLSTIIEGNTYVSPAFATTLLNAAQKNDKEDGGDQNLTHREVQILRELEAGRTNREIAGQLSISEKTVKFYMSNIMQKFGVKNRVAAIMAFQKSYGAKERPAPSRLA
jgi:two-component system nitrate/nitrite response regulator NarL